MGFLIAFLVLVLLACIPLGVKIRYNESGPKVSVIAGPVKYQVFPTKKKPRTEKKTKKAKKETAPTKPKKTAEEEKGGSLTDFLPLLELIPDFLGDVRRKLRIDRLECKLILAGDDPCDLAVNYGRAWAAVGNLLPLLEQWFVIRKRSVEVLCDFTADSIRILAHVDITITVGRIFSLGFRHGIRALREFLRIMKLRKGGASE